MFEEDQDTLAAEYVLGTLSMARLRAMATIQVIGLASVGSNLSAIVQTLR